MHAVRFSRAHEDGADERRCFGELEARVAGLLRALGLSPGQDGPRTVPSHCQ